MSNHVPHPLQDVISVQTHPKVQQYVDLKRKLVSNVMKIKMQITIEYVITKDFPNVVMESIMTEMDL
jgi:hypothetical protein